VAIAVREKSSAIVGGCTFGSPSAFVEIEVACKKIRSPRAPVRMSETPARAPMRAPHLGEHTDEVLRRLLSYSDEQLRTLRNKRVC
jgi:crotonobetainyl-CoA:carnitine CoA-transferase CaiB-like acyl-CoA transferase